LNAFKCLLSNGYTIVIKIYDDMGREKCERGAYALIVLSSILRNSYINVPKLLKQGYLDLITTNHLNTEMKSMETWCFYIYEYIHGETLESIASRQDADLISFAMKLINGFSNITSSYKYNKKPTSIFPKDSNLMITRKIFTNIIDDISQIILSYYKINEINDLLESIVKIKRAFNTLYSMYHKYDSKDMVNTIVHSDLNFANIILGKDGKMYIIDWDYSYLGSGTQNIADIVSDLLFKSLVHNLNIWSKIINIINSLNLNMSLNAIFLLLSILKGLRMFLRKLGTNQEYVILCKELNRNIAEVLSLIRT